MGLPFACKWGLVADWVVLKDPFLRVSILQLGSRCLTLVMGGPAHWLNKLAQERRVACGSETVLPTGWLVCLSLAHDGGIWEHLYILLGSASWRACWHADHIVLGPLWNCRCVWSLYHQLPCTLSLCCLCLVLSYKCLCMCISDASVASWWWCKCAVLTTLFCQWLQCLNKHGVCTADVCIVLLSILLELVVHPKVASTAYRSQ